MTNRPVLHALTSIIAAGLALAACGGGESATDTDTGSASADVSAPTTAVSTTDAPVAAATTQPAASPSTAPADPTTAPAPTTGAPAVTDGEGFDDPDTCDEATAYIEGLAGQGLELLEMPQDDALDVMGAMNVLSATCDPEAALAFLQRPDIVEFMN